MSNNFRGTYAYKTDIGRVRSHNEDQAMVVVNASGEVFMIVCDGMGGANKGDVASKMAIDSLCESFRNKKRMPFAYLDKLWLTRACKAANKSIYDLADKKPAYKGMGTTLVAALISGNRLLIGNIGDSRAYMIVKNEIKQLTVDQTYVHFLVETGKISKEQALTHPERHVLMNALGIYPSLSLTISQYPYHGESMLLCSDGLYNQLSEKEILSITSTDERVDQKVTSLIVQANSNGGSDNEGVSYWESMGHD
ncbi:MAG: Stp1/IreP family PP2C-type Ser/Thr phosphatase [Bacilli bacterium]|jgi:protein phosphatase|nr:Stp1/IreP family PP2C-type Ser/Thr phosphatase [Bacilli bacterium]MCH4210866.1 Stp1/IreP family PP2C-type Ser/Thr phosphatase [Bacilli bacterium]MCH4228382.1 Stp1/IreP family PP2C-type Ser/Thr phosphatase [Bacilli bacterium]MCH4277931.1 Stp1/IreP family PP2C-type Ser/Thr phosphatase [Bacilli bacterium]MCI2054881.1 Stp1/IreP family PP2C-type Ser/Thr phosphatase [Bacilli bacterium]